ncbi:MAG: DUF1799 domain-containing protein [Rhodoferax sp.]
MQTQWRCSMNGRDSLDYSAVLAYMRGPAGMSAKDTRAMFPALQAMEIAALNARAEKQQQGA